MVALRIYRFKVPWCINFCCLPDTLHCQSIGIMMYKTVEPTGTLYAAMHTEPVYCHALARPRPQRLSCPPKIEDLLCHRMLAHPRGIYMTYSLAGWQQCNDLVGYSMHNIIFNFKLCFYDTCAYRVTRCVTTFDNQGVLWEHVFVYIIAIGTRHNKTLDCKYWVQFLLLLLLYSRRCVNQR